MNFTELHYQSFPLLLANVWDASSACAAERAGYQALGTSSAAIAAMLGYEDGESLCFDELYYIIRRIRAVTALPISVDMESGYADTPAGIADNLQQLASIGIVGVNLEDSQVSHGVRVLDEAERFASRLQAVRKALAERQCSLFLNVRSDPFLMDLPNAREETLFRAQCYATHGADGIFVPCITSPEDIAAIVKHVPLPLNVMAMPGLPDFTMLAELGVRRISMGNALHSVVQNDLNMRLLTVRQQQSFAGVFADEDHR